MTVRLDIEVVVATPGKACVVKMAVPAGTTIRQAIERARSAKGIDDIYTDNHDVGIYSVKCNLDKLVNSGDRIEIYRSLMIDPKDRRKRKAKDVAAK